jgi:hypothetical protein
MKLESLKKTPQSWEAFWSFYRKVFAQPEFHCSAFSRNETLAVSGGFLF